MCAVGAPEYVELAYVHATVGGGTSEESGVHDAVVRVFGAAPAVDECGSVAGNIAAAAAAVVRIEVEGIAGTVGTVDAESTEGNVAAAVDTADSFGVVKALMVLQLRMLVELLFHRSLRYLQSLLLPDLGHRWSTSIARGFREATYLLVLSLDTRKSAFTL